MTPAPRIIAGLAVLAVSVLAPAPAAAAEERPLWGYGVRSCADYLAAATAADGGNDGDYRRYEDWLTGFLSGLNLATGQDVLRGSGIGAAMQRTRAYCGGRPDADFFTAAMDLVRTLNALK